MLKEDGPCLRGNDVAGGPQSISALTNRNFRQDDVSAQFIDLPGAAPDQPVTVIEAECDSEPHAEGLYVREHRQREKVGVSWS